MTNRAVTFVGEIDLICYCWKYCRGVIEVLCVLLVVCEYNGSVVGVLWDFKSSL